MQAFDREMLEGSSSAHAAFGDWFDFAMSGNRLLALEDKKSESRPPPSNEIKEYLHESISKLTSVSKSIKSISKQLGAINVSARKRLTFEQLVSKAFSSVREMENQVLGRLEQFACTNLHEASDKTIAKLLKDFVKF